VECAGKDRRNGLAGALNVHPDTVRRAIEVERFQHAEPLRPSVVDPYLPFVREVLAEHPRLRATRIYHMIRDRGYPGSVEQLRRAVARLRPHPREAFLRLQVFPAEEAQVDWAYFGPVMVGRAKRQLSCFVITLSWSRALYLEFFFDQTIESFLCGHVRAFQDWSGAPRVVLYDNLRSAVLERRGDQVHFNPRLLELAAHYHLAPRPCQVRTANHRSYDRQKAILDPPHEEALLRTKRKALHATRGPAGAGRSGKRSLAGTGFRPGGIGRHSNRTAAAAAGPVRRGRLAPRRAGSAGAEHAARVLGCLPAAAAPSLGAAAGAGSEPPSGGSSARDPSPRSGDLR
jgi:transposase